MKKRLFVLLIPALGIAGCLKNDIKECIPTEVTVKAPEGEVSSLRGYLSANGISTQEDSRGFFYNISTPGSGVKPNTCSIVTVDYVAKLTNGNTVDSNNNVQYNVGAFITGWKEALPLLSPGGSMTLYLPPSLAYGSAANGNVPANSNLVFFIALKEVH